MSAHIPARHQAPPRAEAAAVVSAPVYVYSLPVRIWHWVTALAIVVLSVTGFLIGDPVWPQLNGEPSQMFIMGDIRVTHFIAGYVLAIMLVVRMYRALVGGRYEREIFVPAVWEADWWRGFYRTIRWYLFLERETAREIGHNPLEQIAMLLMFTCGVLFEIVTGFALYGEGTGYGSWAYSVFTSWVDPLVGNSQLLHTWHHLGMWYLIIFSMFHIYMVNREDIMARYSVMSTMFSGWRFYKDNRP